MQQNHSESRPNERSELQGAAPGHGRDSQAQTVELGRTRCYWTILDVNVRSFALCPLSLPRPVRCCGLVQRADSVCSDQLNFIFLDPILAEHLGEECSKFIGTNLLSFVHPEELVRMRSDLLPRPGVLSGVQAAGVFGAVTRFVPLSSETSRQLLMYSQMSLRSDTSHSQAARMRLTAERRRSGEVSLDDRLLGRQSHDVVDRGE